MQSESLISIFWSLPKLHEGLNMDLMFQLQTHSDSSQVYPTHDATNLLKSLMPSITITSEEDPKQHQAVTRFQFRKRK